MSTKKPGLGNADTELGPDGRPLVRPPDMQKVTDPRLGVRNMPQVPNVRLRHTVTDRPRGEGK